ncbi:cupin domain-containing protein [Chondromyces apiculatus]|uniref:Mannose-6-phosphate isomerase n=1 Tax=Chondromyces apiculatus DSM 436 TaxID=1192034 RepID=A0A017SVK4_9BACT|nr:cupin domain-containing protein [Chondromyces apiculatus]EYF01008.1 Mannose-6-phosphate isomerase [Chondromyces apiculatus DSM 436]
MTRPRVFSFDDPGFQRALAHHGGAPILFHRVADARSGAANWIDLVIVPRGADIGLHTHGDGDEEVYVILAGRGRMTLDAHAFEVGPGHVVVNRPGGTHSLVNVGEDDLRLVVVDVRVPPPGGPASPPTPQQQEEP